MFQELERTHEEQNFVCIDVFNIRIMTSQAGRKF